jgi:hypothetical protein
MRPKHTLVTVLCVAAVSLYFAGAWLALDGKTPPAVEARPRPANQVVLSAKPWNDGYVHIWATLSEGEVAYTDLREGTLCRKVGGVHHLGRGATAIPFYFVDCGDVRGYVEIDQER